jgi:hypothetical protein
MKYFEIILSEDTGEIEDLAQALENAGDAECFDVLRIGALTEKAAALLQENLAALMDQRNQAKMLLAVP